MPSPIQRANLTVNISESITLDGKPWNSEATVVIPNINETDKRIVTAPAGTEIYLLKFGAVPGPGQYKAADVKYLRITNKDDTNFISVKVTDDTTSTQVYFEKILPGQSKVIGNTALYADGAGTAFSAFETASGIAVTANTADVDVEYFIALT